MYQQELAKLFQAVKDQELTPEAALQQLQSITYADLGVVKIDHQRALRKGFPEVVYGETKTLEQLNLIWQRLCQQHESALITRLSAEKYLAMQQTGALGQYNPIARTLSYHKMQPASHGRILILTAGTSDASVAEEAHETALIMGNFCELVQDVGVAGLHRLLDKISLLREARVIIVVAGMEGALASVVGGLVQVPVIAVPTSVGYGANFQGLAPLLSMLNSCSPGVVTVNIDNGFGAAYTASLINQIENTGKGPLE